MAKPQVCVISDAVYRSTLVWDTSGPQNYYGSESYHCLLAFALQQMGLAKIHFIAPGGSTPIGTLHPTLFLFGQAIADENITNLSIMRPRETSKFLLDMDYVIDMSASCRHPEYLWYRNFDRFVCYRNGYDAYGDPRLPPEARHYVVPSTQNQRLFAEGGFEADVIPYGIPDFYDPGENSEFWGLFEEKYKLTKKEYLLFPHRPGPEKGADIVVQLAEMLPKETFVIPTTALIGDHIDKLNRLMKVSIEHNLTNIKFVQIPQNPWYHYYKRELMRNCKACLSPFNPKIYYEGFGLASKEVNACGRPVIISDSESTRELYLHGKDAIIVPADGRNWGPEWFAHYITQFSTFNFQCENRYLVEDMAAAYMGLLQSKYTL